MARLTLFASCVSLSAWAAVLRRQPQFVGEIGVPVIEVIVTGDAPPSDALKLHSVNVSREELEQEKCEEEMFRLAFNRTRMSDSHACERRLNSTQYACQQLEHGNVSAAMASVERTFRECAGVSESCARRAAPDVVRKMRLSGMAVDQQCKLQAEKLEKDEMKHKPAPNVAACEDNATHGMVDGLQQDDLEKAMTEAQHALKTCNGLPAPCDFQLAPMLVGNLLEFNAMAEQAQMAQFLIAGLNAARQIQSKLTKAAPQAKGPAHVKEHKSPISLVSLATSTRVSSKMGLLKF